MAFSSSQQIRYGSIISYISIVFSLLAGLLYTPWVIDTIGKADYGIYTLVISIIGFFLIDFGLGSAIARFIAKYNAASDQKSINNLLGVTSRLYLLIDLFISLSLVVFYFAIPYLYQGFTSAEVDNFKIVYVIASIFSVVSFPAISLNGILVAYEKFIQLKLCDLLHKVGVVTLMVIALLFGGELYSLIFVNALVGILVIGAKFWIVHHTTSVRVDWHYRDRKLFKEIFDYSAWSAVVSICQRFIFNITPSIIGVFLGSVEIGIFGIAMMLEAYVFNFSYAIGGLFLARVSQIITSERRDEIVPLMIKVGRIQLMIVGLIFICFFAIGDEFITLWIGEGFRSTYICTLLLIAPGLIQFPQEIANTTIVAMNRVKLQAYVFVVMAVVNISLSLLLIGSYGVIGVSLSICISYLIRTLLMNIIYKRELKIDISHFFKECYWRLMPGMVSGLLIGFVVRELWVSSGWGSLLIKGGVIVLSYCAIIYVVSMNRYEKELVRSFIKS